VREQRGLYAFQKLITLLRYIKKRGCVASWSKAGLQSDGEWSQIIGKNGERRLAGLVEFLKVDIKKGLVKGSATTGRQRSLG